MQQFKYKPFVLLGVNSDSRQKLSGLLNDKTITWPVFWDGGNAQGPIAGAWNIRGWPSIFVLDRQGIIQYRGRDTNVDELVAKLLEAKPAQVSVSGNITPSGQPAAN